MNPTVLHFVFERFAPLLYQVLNKRRRSFAGCEYIAGGKIYNEKFGSTSQLGADEATRWDNLYNVMARTELVKSKLVVPLKVSDRGMRVRVHAGTTKLLPVQPLEYLEAATLHIQIYCFVAFSDGTPDSAFFCQDIYMKDSRNRWIYKPLQDDQTKFVRYVAARSSFNFDPDFAEEKPNFGRVLSSWQSTFRYGVSLNHVPSTSTDFTLGTDVSDNLMRIEHFLWQAQQFMAPYAHTRGRVAMM